MITPLAQYYFPWQTNVVFLLPFVVLHGPLLYMYVRSFKETITWKKAWPHFLLLLVFIFIALYLGKVIGSHYPLTKNMPGEVLHSPFTIVPTFIRLVQMLTYYFLSRKTLASYRRSINYLFSDTSKINLSWVKVLINGYLFLLVASFSLYSLVLQFPAYVGQFMLILAAITTVYIYMATINGI